MYTLEFSWWNSRVINPLIGVIPVKITVNYQFMLFMGTKRLTLKKKRNFEHHSKKTESGSVFQKEAK